MDPKIEVGFQTFLSDAEEPFGSVRATPLGRKEVIVSVANAGDFAIPLDAVKVVEKGNVTFDCTKLADNLREAIGHAHSHEPS